MAKRAISMFRACFGFFVLVLVFSNNSERGLFTVVCSFFVALSCREEVREVTFVFFFAWWLSRGRDYSNIAPGIARRAFLCTWLALGIKRKRQNYHTPFGARPLPLLAPVLDIRTSKRGD